MCIRDRTAALPLAGLTINAGTMAAPGFLRCIVTAQVAGHSYRGLATAAFSPEKITPTQVEPADFDAFWVAGKADLAKVPIDARMTLMPDACTSTVDVYHVSFRTIGPKGPISARIYGILCEPRAPGRYAAILKVPGAGVRPYSGDPELASKGAIVLEIGIHGLPVNLAKEVYDELGAGALNGYWLYKDVYKRQLSARARSIAAWVSTRTAPFAAARSLAIAPYSSIRLRIGSIRKACT